MGATLAERVAVRHGARALRFADLVDRIDRIGNGVLTGLGPSRSSHAGILAGNRLGYVELLLRLADARVAPVQLSPTLRPEELALFCADSRFACSSSIRCSKR